MNTKLYFHLTEYSQNSFLKLAYFEEYDNHFNVPVLG